MVSRNLELHSDVLLPCVHELCQELFVWFLFYYMYLWYGKSPVAFSPVHIYFIIWLTWAAGITSTLYFSSVGYISRLFVDVVLHSCMQTIWKSFAAHCARHAQRKDCCGSQYILATATASHICLAFSCQLPGWHSVVLRFVRFLNYVKHNA